MFNFEKLESWHRAIDFADLGYSSTRDFPRDEMFGLTMQMRRAAVSVSSNLAEGGSRSSRTDFGRFTEIAAGSPFEVVSQSVIAKRRGFLNETDHLKAYQDAERLGKNAERPSKLAAFEVMNSINYQRSAINAQ